MPSNRAFLYPIVQPTKYVVNIETKRTGEDLRDAQYKLQASASCADCFCLLAAVTCCLHPFEKVVERRLLRSCVKNKF